MEIKQYIKENEARFMEELFSLIRIPSISALPEHKDDMLACALRWTRTFAGSWSRRSHGNALTRQSDWYLHKSM